MSAGRIVRNTSAGLLALLVAALTGGCPQPLPPLEFVAGTTGDATNLSGTASVDVLAPVSDFSITGGTPVEVNWRATARTRTAVLEVFLDPDTNPDNDNEILIASSLPLTTSSVVIDTTSLGAGQFNVGVLQREVGTIVATDYATGRITINQRPTLFFTAPRDNSQLDRTVSINPRFNVAWTVSDPDSIVNVTIFLDPDANPNGNEVQLRESNSQTGDSFTFDLPTASFTAGTYRILALVSDGLDTFTFYAPGTIRLRSRLAGNVDLRDLELPRESSPVRGAVFEGFNPRDNAGTRVDTINDLDGDGFEDFVIAAQFGKPDYGINIPRTGVGEAYLIYGRTQRFSGRINLNSTGTLFRGEVLSGVPEVPDPIRPSRGITDIVALDDWDRDGVREIAIGMPFTDSLSSFLAIGTVNDGVLDPSGYFRTGCVVIVAGSVWRPDLGFPGRNVIQLANIGNQPHEGFVAPQCFEGFYGPKSPLPFSAGPATTFHRHIPGLGTPLANRQGCRFSTVDFGDQCGETVSPYDFDGIIVSTPNRDAQTASLRAAIRPGAGVATVYFNNTGNGSYQWGTANAVGAGNGYPGVQANSAVGANGIPHGGPYFYIMDDLRSFLGPIRRGPVQVQQDTAPQFTFRQYSPGYIVSTDGPPACAEPGDFGAAPTAQRTVRFYGSELGDRVSNAVGVRDFNADGIEDIAIGSPFSGSGAGAVYLILGRLRELVRGSDMDLAELGLPLAANPGQNRRLFDGIRILGKAGDRLGESQDSAGDFNGDGISDIVIGSAFVNSRRGGAAVLFGSRELINLTEDEIPFDEIADRGLGINFVGEAEGDLAGARVAGVRDIDGDGLDDIMIAAPDRSIKLDIDLDGEIEIDRTKCGVVYLIYGSSRLRGTLSLSAVGSSELPGVVFVGAHSDDQLGAGIGEQGDRARAMGVAGDVDADGRVDLLLASPRATPRGGRVRAGETYLIYGVGD